MNLIKFSAFASLVAAVAAFSAPAVAESYVHLERMPVVFNGNQADARLMLVEITLAVVDGREADLRRRSHTVKAAILRALQSHPFAYYHDDNAADVVKMVARRAAQKAAADVPITDALIKSLQLR